MEDIVITNEEFGPLFKYINKETKGTKCRKLMILM